MGIKGLILDKVRVYTKPSSFSTWRKISVQTFFFFLLSSVAWGSCPHSNLCAEAELGNAGQNQMMYISAPRAACATHSDPDLKKKKKISIASIHKGIVSCQGSNWFSLCSAPPFSGCMLPWQAEAGCGQGLHHTWSRESREDGSKPCREPRGRFPKQAVESRGCLLHWLQDQPKVTASALGQTIPAVLTARSSQATASLRLGTAIRRAKARVNQAN